MQADPAKAASEDGTSSGDAHQAQPAASREPLRHLAADLRREAAEALHQLRKHLRILTIFATTTFAAGMIYAWSGLYDVGASSGHYPFFRVFLGWAMRNSVETQSSNVRAPALDDPAMIQRGAAHFQGGCAFCHGSPSLQRSPIAVRMLPEPPYLGQVLSSWTPQQKFWIVKHGIKYAGMPNWPALERDDEVWSVVAFLEKLPGMDPAIYRQLAYGAVADERSQEKDTTGDGLRQLLAYGPTGNGIAACARCHGFEGNGSRNGAFPRLPGQTPDYLYRALKGYALGTRPSGIMQPVAASLTDAEMRSLASYFSAAGSLSPQRSRAQPASASLRMGGRIALRGIPERNVAGCASCHGATRPPLYPSLDGQYAGYLAGQLRLWTQGKRGDGPFSDIMTRAVGLKVEGKITRTLTEREILAVSAYYSALPPARVPRDAPAAVARR